QCGPGVGREQVEPEVGRTDVVGLLDDQLPPRVESAGRAGEGESDQQPQDREHRPIHRADTLRLAGGVVAQPPDADATTDLQEEQHAQKQPEREREHCDRVAHTGSPPRRRIHAGQAGRTWCQKSSSLSAEILSRGRKPWGFLLGRSRSLRGRAAESGAGWRWAWPPPAPVWW